jgi:protein-L-isoaspartate(D-aspartate) O-methyltransferase
MQKGDKQIITRFIKNGDTIDEEELEECDFVPVLDGIEKYR